MKSSLFLVATSALLASAGPLRKRVEVTDWVTEVYTVTVYDDGSSPTSAVYAEPPKTTAPPAVVLPELTPKAVSSVKPAATTPAAAPKVVSNVKKPAANTPAAPSSPPAPAKPVTKVAEVKPQPSLNSSPSNKLDDYQKTVIDRHDLHRKNHSAAALAWDDTLAQYAANTANSCVFAHDMKQGRGGYGQNLASQGSTGDIDGLKLKSAAQAITDQWYNGEVNSYNSFYGMANPPSNVPLGDFGHFTQLVWKDSQKVGCATVKCPAGTIFGMASWYTVCNYEPAGNFGGEYGKNVLQPLGLSIAVV